VLLAHLLAPWWTGAFADLAYTGALPLAVWLVLPISIQAAALVVFQAQGRPAAFVATTVMTTAGGQLLGLGLLTDRGTPEAYLAGLVIGAWAGVALGLVLLRPRAVRPAPLDRVGAAIRHGGPTVAHLLGFMVLALADRVLIERIIGLESAARYQVAYVVGSAGSVLLYGLNNAWGPMVYAESGERRWDLLARTTVSLAWLVGLVVAAVALAAPVGLAVLAPSSYDLGGLSDVAALVAAATVFDLVYLTAAHVLFAGKRTGALLVVMPIAAAVNVALNLVTLERWGLVAAALSTLVGYGVMAVLTVRASRRVADVPWDLPAFAAPFGIAALAVAVAVLLPTDGAALGLRLIGAGAAMGALAVGVVRTMRPDDLVSAIRPTSAATP
jgi:O-antigen/teichoic acid export membrane protein